MIRGATGPVTVTVLLGVFVLGALPPGLAVPVQRSIYGAAQPLAITLTWLDGAACVATRPISKNPTGWDN